MRRAKFETRAGVATSRFSGRRQFMGAAAGLGACLLAPHVVLAADEAPKPAGASRLVLLGTSGGPSPKPNRAAPAQAIIVNGATYLVDCGNGVGRQMVLAKLKFSSLRDIFITHLHSDHDADYGNVLLLGWATDLHTKVNTYGPPPLVHMTQLFLEMNDVDIQTRIIDEGRPPLADLIVPHEFSGPGLVMQDENVKVTAAVVQHPLIEPAFAYRFDCPDRSIVISGDTRPSDNLIALAKGADVLVHEVMYLPAIEKLIEAEPDAKRLRQHLLDSHTTTEEVGRVATEAGVKTLVLSHFVPGGYPFITDEQWRDAVAPHFKGNLVIGRDLMEL